MRSTSRTHTTLSAAAGALLLVTLASAAGHAGTPSTTAYYFSSHPMISGTVVTVNDHQMVVNTDQGEQVVLEIDSQTMAPRDLAAGMVMRADFKALEDCRFYAQRIMAVRPGTSRNRLQAYANTRDDSGAMASSMSAARDAHPANLDGSRVSSDPPQATDGTVPGRMMNATPATADYESSTNPMISGRVAAVNDHRLVVQTVQGQPLGLVMDSRTMLPADIQPGVMFRAEFNRMDDGRYYATRITREASDVAAREPAYAHTRDGAAVMAAGVSDCGDTNMRSNRDLSSAAMPAATIRETPPSVTPYVGDAVEPTPEPEMLPQTASDMPLILMLGLLAVGAAGGLWVLRRIRSA